MPPVKAFKSFLFCDCTIYRSGTTIPSFSQIGGSKLYTSGICLSLSLIAVERNSIFCSLFVHIRNIGFLKLYKLRKLV